MTKQKSFTIVQSSNSCVWKGSNGPSKNSCKNLDPNPPKLQIQKCNKIKQTKASSSSSEKWFLPCYFKLQSFLAVNKISHCDGTLEKLPSRVNDQQFLQKLSLSRRDQTLSFICCPQTSWSTGEELVNLCGGAGVTNPTCWQRGTARASRRPGQSPSSNTGALRQRAFSCPGWLYARAEPRTGLRPSQHSI